jgi:hypothetical protein
MKICKACKSEYQDYEHPKHDVCSLECLKKLGVKAKKLKYKTMTVRGRGKSHLILVQEPKFR